MVWNDTIALAFALSIIGGFTGVLLREFDKLERFSRRALVVRAVITGSMGFTAYIVLIKVSGFELFGGSDPYPPFFLCGWPFFLFGMVLGMIVKVPWIR